MKIAVIGTGYVGLVSGVCFSDFGHDVVCVDKNEGKIKTLKKGEVPIYEPGLDTLMIKNVEAGRLSFTTDLASAVDGAEAIFIAVGTPTRRGDGHADLTYVMAAAEEVAKLAKDYVVVVTKSTVPVGTKRQVKQVVRKANPDLEIEGVLLTMFDKRNNLARQVAEDVRSNFSGRVFEAVIPRNVKLSEAPSFGKPILLYDIGSRGCQSYLDLARELMATPAAAA